MNRVLAFTKAVVILSAGAVVAALSGCSSVPLEVNEDPIRASTFSFMEPKASTQPPAKNRAAMHAMIQDAIVRSLNARGLRKVASGGDVTVGYLVVVASNLTTAAVSDYFGYGPENQEIIHRAHAMAREDRTTGPASRIRDPATYRVGALIVDILDSRSLELLYRDVAHRYLLAAGAPEDVRAQRVQEAVDEVLANLRISSVR